MKNKSFFLWLGINKHNFTSIISSEEIKHSRVQKRSRVEALKVKLSFYFPAKSWTTIVHCLD